MILHQSYFSGVLAISDCCTECQLRSSCCKQVYLAYCADVDADVAIKMVKLDDPSIHLVRADICQKNPTLDQEFMKLSSAQKHGRVRSRSPGIRICSGVDDN